MIAAGLFLLLLADGPAQTPAGVPAAPEKRQATPDAPADQETLASFAKVRRIYVDILTGGDAALQIRDLLISSIQKTKLFIVTENEDKADAVLKGAGDDQVFKDTHQSSEGINAHSQFSIGGGSSTNQRYSNRTYGNVGVGENESERIEERKHEAIATVRLVNRDGDVIWSATAESMGAKFAGASVDVVDRIAKRLAADYLRAKSDAK